MEALRRFALLEIREEELKNCLAACSTCTSRPCPRGPGPAPAARRARSLPHAGTRDRDQPRAYFECSRAEEIWAHHRARACALATILLLNDAYVLDPGDEDLIADWLNDISLNLDAD